jgi:hypothetical protein
MEWTAQGRNAGIVRNFNRHRHVTYWPLAAARVGDSGGSFWG